MFGHNANDLKVEEIPDIPLSPNTQRNTFCSGRSRPPVYFSMRAVHGTIATLCNYDKYITLKTKQFESQNHNELTLSHDNIYTAPLA